MDRRAARREGGRRRTAPLGSTYTSACLREISLFTMRMSQLWSLRHGRGVAVLGDSWGQTTAARGSWLGRRSPAPPLTPSHCTHLPIRMVRLSSGNSKSEHPSLPAIISLPNSWGASIVARRHSQSAIQAKHCRSGMWPRLCRSRTGVPLPPSRCRLPPPPPLTLGAQPLIIYVLAYRCVIVAREGVEE